MADAPNFGIMANRCRRRLEAAVAFADTCRSDERVHRAAMTAVFALLDTLFTLEMLTSPSVRDVDFCLERPEPLEGGDVQRGDQT